MFIGNNYHGLYYPPGNISQWRHNIRDNKVWIYFQEVEEAAGENLPMAGAYQVQECPISPLGAVGLPGHDAGLGQPLGAVGQPNANNARAHGGWLQLDAGDKHLSAAGDYKIILNILHKHRWVVWIFSTNALHWLRYLKILSSSLALPFRSNLNILKYSFK